MHQKMIIRAHIVLVVSRIDQTNELDIPREGDDSNLPLYTHPSGCE